MNTNSIRPETFMILNHATTAGEFSIKDAAVIIGHKDPSTRRITESMVEMGILTKRKESYGMLYKINPNSDVCQLLLEIINMPEPSPCPSAPPEIVPGMIIEDDLGDYRSARMVDLTNLTHRG